MATLTKHDPDPCDLFPDGCEFSGRPRVATARGQRRGLQPHRLPKCCRWLAYGIFRAAASWTFGAAFYVDYLQLCRGVGLDRRKGRGLLEKM